jgi:hypothetical protein
MKTYISLIPSKVLLLFSVFYLTISCSTDSDLLLEQVLFEPIAEVNLYVLPDDFEVTTDDSPTDTIEIAVSSKDGSSYNDSYELSSFEGIKLDVLANDEFNRPESALIISTTQPNKGRVEINSDNTLQYFPSSFETYEDSFTYTVEFENGDGSKATETATVLVKMNPPNTASKTLEVDYYVTTLGSASNDGLTEETAWNIEHAFATAKAGDVVAVKAGNYGAVKLATSRAGSPENPIKFIGYKNTPGDIDALNGPTFSKDDWMVNGENFDSAMMPMLDWSPQNNIPVNGDDAFFINHSYVEIHNFFARDYWIGVKVFAQNVTINNVILARLGNWDTNSNCWGSASVHGCDLNNGYGILLTYGAHNGVIKNSMVIDAGMEGVYIIDSNNILIENTHVYSINPGNGTDYYFNITNSTNSIMRDCYGERVHDQSGAHHGRSLVLKCSSNNLIENFHGHRSRIQIMKATNNTLRNIKNTGQYAEFQVIGESDDNIIENLRIDGSYGISFWAYKGEGECGLTSEHEAGSNNYFINPIVSNAVNESGSAAVSLHRQIATTGYSAGTNYIIGGTFHNVPRIINANRPGTVHFYNCSFSNIYTEEDGYFAGSVGGIPTEDNTNAYVATYTNCNFNNTNGFSVPGCTNCTVIEATTGDPRYTNASGGDFTLLSGSILVNAGMDAGTLKAEANSDHAGKTRGAGGRFDIGAFEY